MLSFSNDIAKQERNNIALGGRIERLGMVRDFETEIKPTILISLILKNISSVSSQFLWITQ